MYQRMQILISPEQRQRLQEEAQARDTSVASLIREAIDERFGRLPTREERMAAARRITRRRVRLPAPAELEEMIDSRFDDEYRELIEGR